LRHATRELSEPRVTTALRLGARSGCHAIAPLYLYLQLLYIQRAHDSTAEAPRDGGNRSNTMDPRARRRGRTHAGGRRPAGYRRSSTALRQDGPRVATGDAPRRTPIPPIAETLDFSLISVEAGKAVFQSTPQFKHYNPLGSVHGGSAARNRQCRTQRAATGDRRGADCRPRR